MDLLMCAHTLQAMPSMLLTPLIMWTLLVGWAALWVFTMVFMISADTFVTVNATVATGYGHVKYIPMESYDNFFWYFTFGLFWVSQFFIAVEQLILAGKEAPRARRRECEHERHCFTEIDPSVVLPAAR